MLSSQQCSLTQCSYAKITALFETTSLVYISCQCDNYRKCRTKSSAVRLFALKWHVIYRCSYYSSDDQYSPARFCKIKCIFPLLRKLWKLNIQHRFCMDQYYFCCNYKSLSGTNSTHIILSKLNLTNLTNVAIFIKPNGKCVIVFIRGIAHSR